MKIVSSIALILCLFIVLLVQAWRNGLMEEISCAVWQHVPLLWAKVTRDVFSIMEFALYLSIVMEASYDQKCW